MYEQFAQKCLDAQVIYELRKKKIWLFFCRVDQQLMEKMYKKACKTLENLPIEEMLERVIN